MIPFSAMKAPAFCQVDEVKIEVQAPRPNMTMTVKMQHAIKYPLVGPPAVAPAMAAKTYGIKGTTDKRKRK
jgi:hypothetical protein